MTILMKMIKHASALIRHLLAFIVVTIIISLILIHILISSELEVSSINYNGVKLRKRSILLAIKAPSVNNHKLTSYRRLLQHQRLNKACAGFHIASQKHLEGNFNKHSSEYKLVQVHSFFSPGQTLPKELPALKSPKLTCKITDLLSTNPKLKSFEESIHMRENYKNYPDRFKLFSPSSKKPVCFLGDLTPLGILQQIEHGEFMRKAYNNIIQETSHVEKLLTVQSIPDQLQYQNSLAFAVGFLTLKQFVRLNVNKSLPDFAPKSMNKLLNCPQLSMFSSKIDNAINSGQFIFKEAYPSTKHLATLFNSTDLAKSSSLEILLTTLGYLCNKITPVCRNDKNCVKITMPGLTEAFRMSDNYFRSLIVNPLFTKISKLSTYPVLRGILEKVAKPETFFHMYSSKLSFLFYLLRTLGLKVNKRPIYTSHFIFEIYADSMGQKFFRILFNGEDLTNQVLSCNRTVAVFANLCPLSILDNFIAKRIFEEFQKQTYIAACQ